MEKIIVATDFSQTSDNALEYAIQLAKDIDAQILLFHTYQMPLNFTEEVALTVDLEMLKKETEEILKNQADKLRAKWGVEINYLTRLGIASDEIIEEGKNASFIVMGTYGSGKLARALIGSTALAVIKKSSTPVLLIPEHIIYKRPTKIAFACDYNSKTDFLALNPLKQLTELFHAQLLVMSVKERNEKVSIDEKTTAVKIDKKLAELDHRYYFVENEDLVEGINDFIKDKSPDMIAVIPHKYNLFESLVHASATKKLANQTTIPFLALPDIKAKK